MGSPKTPICQGMAQRPTRNQSLMQRIMDGMVSKKRKVDGVPTSLCDLGFCDVGLDDNWQDCKGGHQYHYHDDAGIPIINRERFPDMITMTSHAHQLLVSQQMFFLCACNNFATDACHLKTIYQLTPLCFAFTKRDISEATQDARCGGTISL